MPDYTIPHQIQYPIGGDFIKADSLEAKLASDMKAIATTAAAALTVEGSRAEQAAKDAAATDATAKAGTAKTDAIADATAKYGGLPHRMTDVEAKNVTQDGRLEHLESVAPKVSNLALDTDSTPFVSPGSTQVHVIPDTDGNPYYITFGVASSDASGNIEINF